jgi:predicted dehydrogenase
MDPARGKRFADQYTCEAFEHWQDLCRHPEIDFCGRLHFPRFPPEPVELCAREKKHKHVQKPIATNLETAGRMVQATHEVGILLGVVSQHRFDDSIQFLRRAIVSGRLGRILEADAYVKWFRTDEYYRRGVKGSWQTEGGGALINQAIHQIDLLLWLVGPIRDVEERTLAGLERARKAGKHIGRPHLVLDRTAIRQMVASGTSLRRTAAHFGVDRTTITNIVRSAAS